MEFAYWHWVLPIPNFLLNEEINCILLIFILGILWLESKSNSNAYPVPYSQFLLTLTSSNCIYSLLHASHSIINLPSQTSKISISSTHNKHNIPFFQHSTMHLTIGFQFTGVSLLLHDSLLIFNVLLQPALILHYIFLEHYYPISSYPWIFFYIPLVKARSYIKPSIFSLYIYMQTAKTTDILASL